MIQHIPTEQWAQVVEQTGKRMFLEPNRDPFIYIEILTLLSCCLQENSSAKARSR
jgi:hypothetical protein